MINDYRAIQSKLNFLLEDEIFKQKLIAFNEKIDEKLSDFKPTFMIYGTYNSGKSTLLNALFGKEVADMGDMPTTKQIHEYTYDGFTIYDTPGLNAKSEDDETTLEHLKTSDVVIFVMSNDGSVEEKYIYERIGDVVKNKKKILIVVNNKAGLELGGEDDNAVKSKILQNLQKVATQKNIEDISGIQVVSANALSALKAKLNGKQILLERSGFLEVEYILKRLIREANEQDIENTLNLLIKNTINEMCQICDENMESDGAKQTASLVTYLEKQKQNLDTRLNSLLSDRISGLKDQLRRILSNSNSEENSIKQDIDSCINKQISNMSDEVANILNLTIEEVSLKIDQFKASFDGLSGTNLNIDVSTLLNKNEAFVDVFLIPSEIKDGVMKAITDKELVANAAKSTLEFVKKTLPDVMKGKGTVWIGKASEAIGKYAGPVINVLSTGYDIYNANKEYQEAVERENNRAHAIQSCITEIASTLSHNLELEFQKVVQQAFNPLLKTYIEIVNALGSKNSNLGNIKKELIMMSNEIKK